MRGCICVALVALVPATAAAQGRVRAAREAAEMLVEKFGARAGRGVPELAGKIEGIAVKYGDDAILAIRRGGPESVALVEAAGADGAKALRVLALHGEQGAVRVLSRPAANKLFMQYGDDAAAALVRHPGVAEPLIERGGTQAVKALAAVNPQNGRRLAMLTEGELASSAARHPEVMGVVATHGERAAEFLWKNKKVLAGGAALGAFLYDPKPYLNGTRDIMLVAGKNVVKPVVGGVFNLLNALLIFGGLIVLVLAVLAYKYLRREDVGGILSLLGKWRGGK